MTNRTKNTSSLTVHPLNWDSAVYGLRMGKIVWGGSPPKLDTAEFLEFLSAAEQSFDHLHVAVPTDEFEFMAGLQKNGFYLVDVLPVLACQRKDFGILVPTPDVSFGWAKAGDETALIAVARDAFTHSRFYNDARLWQMTGANPNGVYQKWLVDALTRSDKFVLTILKNKVLAGFLLFTNSGERSAIELVAIQKEWAGQGLATKLLHHYQAVLMKQGVERIEAGVNINNREAFRFYTKNHFQIISSYCYFHRFTSRDAYTISEIRDEYEWSAKNESEEFAKVKWGSSEGMLNRFRLAQEQMDFSCVPSWCDIGSGTGTFLSEIEKTHVLKKFIGIDLSPSLVTLAQNKKYRTENHEFICSNFMLEFSHESFDVVTAIGVLQKCGVPLDQAVQRLASLVKKNGIVFVTTKNRDWNKITRGEIVPYDGHHWFGLKELREAFRKAGLKIQKMAGFDPRVGTDVLPSEDSHSVFIVAVKEAE